MLSQPLLLLCVVASIVLKCDGICNTVGGNDIISISDWSGEITSPDYTSGRYPDLQDCFWKIKVSSGSKVKVKIELFDLEEGVYKDKSPDEEKLCLDFVTISDSRGKTLFKKCGVLEDTEEVTSSANNLTIHFHSDGSGAARGFRMSHTGVCEGDAPVSGIIESPNYPGPPPPGVSCAWRVGDPSRTLRLLHLLQPGSSSPVKAATDGGQEVSETGGVSADRAALPACGLSPFRVIPTNSSNPTDELCLEEPAWAYLEDITLVYDSSILKQGEELWAGRVRMDLTDDTSCASLCAHASSCQPEAVGGRYLPQCVCLPGYQGPTCAQEVNTCVTRPCVRGSCENLPGPDRRQCVCPADYTGTDCESPATDACSQLTCHNSGVCRVDARGLAHCVCPRDGEFTGQWCHIPRVSAFCQAGADDTEGSLLVWADTLAGADDFRPCPGGSIGNASRHCLPDAGAKTGGTWTRPDLSQCVSPELYQISLDAEALLADSFGDLLTSADVMQKLSIAADEGLSVGQTEAVAVTQAYTQAVDNIVDPSTETTWRNARASLVESKVSSVVTSTQKLVSGVLRGFQLQPSDSTTVSQSPDRSQEVLLDIAARNLDIQVTRVERVDNGTADVFDFGAGSSTISLPVYEVDGSSRSKPDLSRGVIQTRCDVIHRNRPVAAALSKGHPVNIYVARFQSIASLLSIREGRYSKQEQNDSNIINSDVISAEVLTDDNFSRMRNPVELVFTLQNPGYKESLQEKCVFMNMSAGSYSDRWSSRGCHVASSNESHVVCHCYHLTNFAVLMDVFNNQESIDQTQDDILSYISYIGGSLSIVSCVIAIGVFQYFRLSSDRVRIHQQLGVAIVLVQVLYICVVNTGADYNTPVWSCRAVAILMHYSLTAMFCWMLVEGIHLYVVLVKVFKHGSHIKKYSALGWGVPLIVVAVSVAAFRSRYGTGQLCWLDAELLLVCFVPTVGLVLMINTVVLATVIRVMVKSNSSTNKIGTADRNSLRAGLKATVVLLPLLGLTWVLGFLAIRRDQSEAVSYIFTYLFTVTNSCQGVFFLVVHCLLNVDVHQAYERRFSRKKRLSYADTTSSRLRKLSENDISTENNGTPGKSTTTTRSTLTNLSVGLPRFSFRGHMTSADKHPIISLDDADGLSHVTAPPWHGFTSGRHLPEPDYPYPEFPSDRFGMDNPISYPPPNHSAGDDVISDLMLPRPQRNSVRFSNASDLSF